MRRATILLSAVAALTSGAAIADGRDKIRPDVARVERMSARAAERLGDCCRGQSFDRAAWRAHVRRLEQPGGLRLRSPKIRLRKLPPRK